MTASEKEHIKAGGTQKVFKVAVGMSGGVDSSVAALLLKQKGYDVTGVYMQCWEIEVDGCAADEDKAYALQNAASIGIPFKTLDFKKEYRKKVIDYFYSEYRAGRTPNPDVMCNKEIKFGIFYEWAMKEGFDFVATGHYADIIDAGNGEFQLLSGVDTGKDQSYFLYRLGQEQLKKIIFPLGDMLKSEVRETAVKNALPSSKRPESMGICFIGEVDIKDFISKEISPKLGDVVDSAGKVVGEHDGVWFFTIGQRHGFRLKEYFGSPMYVISKDAEKNILVIGTYEEALKDKFEAGDLHWIGSAVTADPIGTELMVRIRHLGKILPCKVTPSRKEGILDVQLSTKVFGVAPGQSAVFYKGRQVLGGGIIN